MREQRFDRCARRAVEIAEHFGVLEESAVRDQSLEHAAIDEVVVLAIDIARPRRPRRVRHRQHDAGLALEQRVDETGFAGAGGAATM